MAKGKKGRAGKAARYKAVVNGSGRGGPSTGRHTQQDIASYYLPNAAPTQSQAVPIFTPLALGNYLLTCSAEFSLADEARHTAHNHGAPESLASLRGRPVAFVSAGVVEPLKELDHDLIASSFDITNVQDEHGPSLVNTSTVTTRHVEKPAARDPCNGPENDPFFVDTIGDKFLAPTRHEPVLVPRPQVRPSSNSGSSSGADHVVFKGRNHQKQQQQQRRPVAADSMTVQVHVVEQTMQHISLDPALETLPQREPTPRIPAWQLRGHDDDADLVADYIANMDNDDDDEDEQPRQQQASLSPSFAARDLGGVHSDFVVPEGSDSDLSSADDNGDDDNDDRDDIDDDDDEDDEANLEQDEELDVPETAEAAFAAASAGSEMDDETLARLLAKQEELGIDQDGLVIVSEEMARYNNRFVATSNSRIAEFCERVEAPWKQVRAGSRNLMPSATAIADALDNYDLAMDWERHNPARKPKAKRGQATFDLTDEELEAHLQDTFRKDRVRKKERKLQRQELRAAGLIGKHGNPEDLRIKYPMGITIGQIKEEMRVFLQGDNET